MMPSARGRRWGLSHPAALTVLTLAAVSWWLSVGRMQDMDAGPGVALGALGWFAATWLLMMAAMMLPAIAPVVAAECFPERSRLTSPRPVFVAAVFVAAYLAVWSLAGAVAYVVLRGVGALAGGVFAWHQGGRWLVVAVLAAAAAYQLTAAKRHWLARCRTQFALTAQQPVGKPGQAVRAGLHAGVRCLASSWALMGALFALGAMSLVWMAVVAVLIAAERLSPYASPARVTAAGLLAALAVGVTASPGSVPGLTVPGTPAAQRAMSRMSGMGTSMPSGHVRHSMSMAPRTGG
jgi:predicted metal-binding membrane protein